MGLTRVRITTMTLKETLKQLEALGNEKSAGAKHQERRRRQSVRRPARRHPDAGEEDQDQPRVGPVSLGDREHRRPVPGDPPDQAKNLSADEMDRMVRSVTFVRVADWLNSYVVKQHPDKETLRQKWMATDDRWAARAGWDLTAERVAKSPEGLDLPALLDRIESEMGSAAPEVQWTMNSALAEIGIHFPKHRKRAIAIGEKLGIYRDYPVSKGCTSPFAPIWINAW